LHARAAHAHAGAHRINVLILGPNRDLAALARFAGHTDDVDEPFGNFRHFHFKKGFQKRGVCARQDDLRPFRVFFHLEEIRANAFAAFVGFAVNLFRGRDHAFRSSQVHNDVAAFEPLDKAVDQFSLTVFIFVIDIVALRVFNPLDNDLLGHLHGDAAEGTGFDFHTQRVTRFRAFIKAFSGFLFRNLCFRIEYFVNNRLKLENLNFSRIIIVVGFDVHILSQLFACCGQHSGLEGFRNDKLVDAPVLTHLLDQTFKFLQHLQIPPFSSLGLYHISACRRFLSFFNPRFFINQVGFDDFAFRDAEYFASHLDSDNLSAVFFHVIRQRALETLDTVDFDMGLDFYLGAPESLKILIARNGAVKTRR